MPVAWAPNIVIPIFKGRMTSGTATATDLLSFLKMVKRMLERRLRRIVSVNEMQVSFMTEKITINDMCLSFHGCMTGILIKQISYIHDLWT